MPVDWFQYDWNTSYIGKKRWHVHSVASTQDFIKSKISEIKQEGAVVVADYQSVGRGRFGNPWIAPLGKSILCSILLKPCLSRSDNEYSRLTLIAQIMTLAICKTITNETSLSLSFKWPNDVLINDKKCAGVIIETTNYQGELVAILGFGLNVNEESEDFLADQVDRTSLLIETGTHWQRPRLLMQIMQFFEPLYESHKRKENSLSLIKQLETYLAWKGENVAYRHKVQWCRGKILGLDEHGYLCLDNGNKINMMRVGEIRRCG